MSNEIEKFSQEDTKQTDENGFLEDEKFPSVDDGDERHKIPKEKIIKEQKVKINRKRSLWAIKITVIALFLAAFFSYLSDLTASSENIVVMVILLLFLIVASIFFDGIGVSVTSCDLAPLMSMASKKVYGAKTAIFLVKNNEKVASICNDLIGDIFGIISGACAVGIVLQIMTICQEQWQQLITIAISSLVAALTIGGKAFIKEIAIKNSKEFVMFVARIMAIFVKEERRHKK